MEPTKFILELPCTISTSPKNLFSAADNITVPSRLTIHGGGYFPSESSGKTWYVSALYNRQATASEFVFGGALEMSCQYR